MSSKRKRHLDIGYEQEKKNKTEAEAPTLPDTNVKNFKELAVLPEEGDNCAIARLVIPKGTKIRFGAKTFELDYNVLEGHRFAVEIISPGQPLLSWTLRFGVCTRTINPGNYVCNKKMLESLRGRGITDLPAEPNFDDKIEPHLIDEKTFKPAEQVPLYPEQKRGFFQGYRRSDIRGVGTRNFVVLIGTTSLSGSYIKALEARVKGSELAFHNVTGIAAIKHTECGGKTKPLNYDLVIRAISGFIVHPNVGAVLVVDYGTEVLSSQHIKEYMSEHKYPLADVECQFLTITGDHEKDLAAGEEIVKKLLPIANQTERTKQPLSNLRIALQCGGSDAFSGVSGNPTAGWAAMELIKNGGCGVLAETPELIGAESYILKRVVDLATAQKFLSVVERFKKLSEFHGFTAEQNPSGGNNFRGLYNIALKSIGAAKKKSADVRLDFVLDYAERIADKGRGYYHMDSPGNDLESIAGQVAVGCNLIFFITGNGSITNFPFVPTIKILTTTRRFELLSKDMDFNAGRFQDAGVPIAELGKELFELAVKNASGVKTVGERAGHTQVVIWRNWAQNDKVDLTPFEQVARSGQALTLKSGSHSTATPSISWNVFDREGKRSWDRIGLVLPTSLCSGEVARMIANQLNEKLREYQKSGEQDSKNWASKVSKFVALPHTEGCGTGYSQSGEQLYIRTMVGHLLHSNVHYGLLLEHGCEKHHNDFMQSHLKEYKADNKTFGWASVQLDGGLENVKEKCVKWFQEQIVSSPEPAKVNLGFGGTTLGLFVTEKPPKQVALLFALLVHQIVAAGGTVVVPNTCQLLSSPEFLDDVMERGSVAPTLAFGQKIDPKSHGCHVMDTPTEHWVETVTGLCATGVNAVLTYTTRALQGHPMIPVIQVTTKISDAKEAPLGVDLALELSDEDSDLPQEWIGEVSKLLQRVATREYIVKADAMPDFQLARGKTSFST